MNGPTKLQGSNAAIARIRSKPQRATPISVNKRESTRLAGGGVRSVFFCSFDGSEPCFLLCTCVPLETTRAPDFCVNQLSIAKVMKHNNSRLFTQSLLSFISCSFFAYFTGAAKRDATQQQQQRLLRVLVTLFFCLFGFCAYRTGTFARFVLASASRQRPSERLRRRAAPVGWMPRLA